MLPLVGGGGGGGGDLQYPNTFCMRPLVDPARLGHSVAEMRARHFDTTKSHNNKPYKRENQNGTKT